MYYVQTSSLSCCLSVLLFFVARRHIAETERMVLMSSEAYISYYLSMRWPIVDECTVYARRPRSASAMLGCGGGGAGATAVVAVLAIALGATGRLYERLSAYWMTATFMMACRIMTRLSYGPESRSLREKNQHSAHGPTIARTRTRMTATYTQPGGPWDDWVAIMMFEWLGEVDCLLYGLFVVIFGWCLIELGRVSHNVYKGRNTASNHTMG